MQKLLEMDFSCFLLAAELSGCTGAYPGSVDGRCPSVHGRSDFPGNMASQEQRLPGKCDSMKKLLPGKINFPGKFTSWES